MPSRRKSAPQKTVTQTPRQGRVTKTKALDTIRNATNIRSRFRAVTPIQSRTLASNSPQVSSRAASPRRATLESADSIDRLSNVLRDGFERMGIQIRQANTSTFDQLMERLDGLSGTAVPVSAAPITSGTAPTFNSGMLSIPYMAPSSLNVLSRWPWVDQTIVESIGNGQFDINHLPKLHREEDVRNRHIKATAEGIFNPFDKTKPAEVLVGRTKMHQAFKDPATFFSAWQVYTSIRTSYCPERGPGLALFSERVYFHIQLNYPWYVILNYILAFFRAHQNSAPDVWNDVDGTLVANNIAVSQQRPAAGNPSKSSTKDNTQSTTASEIPVSQQTCHNWNRMEIGCRKPNCQRRHVCSICDKDGHRAFQCSSSK
jgi:hypothetical protein